MTRADETGTNPALLPYWDPALLAENDAVFTAPDAAAIGTIRSHGVRWLIADADAGPVSPDLGRFATLRYRAGPVAVYELHAGD